MPHQLKRNLVICDFVLGRLRLKARGVRSNRALCFELENSLNRPREIGKAEMRCSGKHHPHIRPERLP